MTSLLLAGVASAAALPVLNEVLAGPPPGWGDANCDGTLALSDVFVELVNAGDSPADLSGWTLSDDTDERHVFPAGTVLAPGDAIVVFDSGVPVVGPGPWGWCGGAGEVTIASSGTLGLAPMGDQLALANDAAEVVDSLAWGAEGASGRSLVRVPELDPAAALAIHDCAAGATGPFTPGARVNGAAFVDPPALPDPGCLPADIDADGLADDVEVALGTDPAVGDTDGDDVPDGREVDFGIDPLNPDSDGDGLRDGDEGRARTNPLDVDTDGDGLGDGDEVMTYFTDPRSLDSDGDGLGDYEEVTQLSTSPTVPDTDGDGLDDGDEVSRQTDPTAPDSDGGGVDDGDEVTNGTDPLDASDDLGGPGPGTGGPDPNLDEDVILRGQCGCASGPGWVGGAPIALVLGGLLRRSRRALR